MKAVPRVLITGAGGMLGRELVTRCDTRGWTTLPRGRQALDIIDAQAVCDEIRAFTPDIVVNCAAYTNVDAAEEHEGEAMQVNALGVRNLAGACREYDVELVHYSTDYIFNGRHTRPIPVDAPADPMNAYGRSKLAGERAVFESGAAFLLVRAGWLFAPHGRNFVRTMLQLGTEREGVRVVHDQRGRPTLCSDLAEATCRLIESGAHGVFHAGNAGECSWFEFAEEIMRLGKRNCLVEPCTTDEFPRHAKRPLYSVLDVSETDALIGALQPWKTALAECIVPMHGGSSSGDARCVSIMEGGSQ